MHILFIGNQSTPICGLKKIKCSIGAEDRLLEKFFTDDLTNLAHDSDSCNCLPSCTSIRYDAEVLQAKFDLEHIFTPGFEIPWSDIYKDAE